MNWIEVKASYYKAGADGKPVKVTETYLVDAMTCAEAEGRILAEYSPLYDGIDVKAIAKTNISEVCRREDPTDDDMWYKVRYSIATIADNKERRCSVYVMVQAPDTASALKAFNESMRYSVADYRTEQITETKVVDVLSYKPSTKTPATEDPQAKYNKR